jgi:hypothetical protein
VRNGLGKKGNAKMADDGREVCVPDNLERLYIMDHSGGEVDVDVVLKSLRQDLVVLVQNVGADWADHAMHQIASRLGLGDSLKLQAGFAAFQGHRHNIGRYFMSVNKRDDYQFVPPHSEGSSFIGMQLAAFFCYQNSTDGGETILMNVDDSSTMWPLLREKVQRGRVGRMPLAPKDISRVRGLYRLNLPADMLRKDDHVLGEHSTDVPGLTILDVLAKPTKTFSRILDCNLNVFWDTVASIDFDSSSQYGQLLKQCGLFKQPTGTQELHQIANTSHRHIWHSGVEYAKLFKWKITRKLQPGDLIIQNNLTWTHSASNWTPGSGTRRIAASFA